ncbi:hypothetical protein JCM1840_005064 [Sporobolomyces johnsonii]
MLIFLDDTKRHILTTWHPIPSVSNSTFELLESLGDCLVAAALSRAIFRHLRDDQRASPALFSSYRTLLQSNDTFSQLSLAYLISTQLDPPLDLTFDQRANLTPTTTKILGNTFEAHVDPLRAFTIARSVRTSSPSSAPCGCYKRALSLTVRRRSTHYDTVTESPF